MQVYDAPHQLIVLLVNPHVFTLLNHLEVNLLASVSCVHSHCHVAKLLELEDSWVLVEFNLDGDEVLALLLRVEDIDCEGKVFLLATCVAVAEGIEASLSWNSLLSFALEQLLLVPCLLVKVWMNLEGKAFEFIVVHFYLRVGLLGVGHCQE